MSVNLVSFKLWSPGNQVFALGAEGVLQVLIQVADILLGIETGQRPKIGAPIGIVQKVVQLEPIPVQHNFRGVAGLITSRGIELVENASVRIDGRTEHSLCI